MGHDILLVEDDADIRTLTTLILTGAGHRVTPVGNGREGLRLVAEHTFDLLILDINLPGMDGWTVTRRLRDDPRTAPLPILIFTVRSPHLDARTPEYTLADAYLQKPFLCRDLLHAVDTTLARRHTARDRA